MVVAIRRFSVPAKDLKQKFVGEIRLKDLREMMRQRKCE